MMAAVEVVNLRVSHQTDIYRRESSEFYSRHHDAQKGSRAVQSEIELLRMRGLAYEQRDADDRATRHIMRIQALEAGARDDTLEAHECSFPTHWPWFGQGVKIASGGVHIAEM
ncbi:hypothetical protein Tco_0743525 [Tanacetum coccineum]